MGACSGPNCKGNSGKGDRMFKFPSDKIRRKKWLINCRWQNWVPGPNSKLCQRHFEESQFEQNRKDGWKKLKQTAIPTLFNLPDPPPKMDNKRRLLVRRPVLFPAATPPAPNRGITDGVEHYPSDLHIFNLNNEKVELADHSYSSSRLKVVVITGDEEEEEEKEGDDVEETEQQKLLQPSEPKRCDKCHLQYLEIRKLRRQVRGLEEQIKSMESNLGTLFAPDQLQFLKIKNKKSMKWSEETIKSSRELKNTIGRRGYELLRKFSYPLPSGGSIYRHLALNRNPDAGLEVPEEGATEQVETASNDGDEADHLAMALQQNDILPHGGMHHEPHADHHMHNGHGDEEYDLKSEEYDVKEHSSSNNTYEYHPPHHQQQQQHHENGLVEQHHDGEMEISHEMNDFVITELNEEQRAAYESGQQLVELPNGEQVMAFPDGQGGLVLENGEHVLLLEEVEGEATA